MRPVARHQSQARSNRIGGVGEALARTVHLDRPRAGLALSGKDVEQLVLALPFQRDDTQNLALVQLEGDVGQAGAGSIARSPTVSPSRSTVARSQIAAISVKRCEM